MDAYFDAGSGIADASDSSPTGVHHYRLRTPFRVNGNASVILGQMATLSAGYEYVDYRSAKLDAYDYEYIEENDNIRQDFQSVHQLKAGAEFRLGALYLRGGTQYLRSPFRDSQNNAESWILSGGIGFRTRGMSLDLGYSHAGRTDVYGLYAYAPGFNEVALNQVRVNKLLCTLAFKF